MSNPPGSSQYPFPNIESFKLKSHQDTDLLLQFLRERQALETTYANDLIKLFEKFKPMCSHRPNVDKLLDFTSALTKDHAQVAKFLSSTANMFERHVTSERRSIIGLQSNLVNSVGPERLEMLAKAEKSKDNYLKKIAENAIASQRTYETTQEINELTQAYRDDIVELEKNRSIILDGREFAKRTFDKYESESLIKIQGFYKAFAKSIDTLARNKLKAAETFAHITIGLKGYKFDEVHFENFWPVPPNVYFEHYESGSPLKDLIFGVPLSFTFRNIPAVIPPFLKHSLEQIEKRGLNIEGLYRVSAKNSDRDKARIELETDLSAFNWDSADIHLLTGLVKAYLRELPEPLFPYSRAERDAYSAITNEVSRVAKLMTVMRLIPRNNLTTLKFLLEHLNRVNAHHDKNKMGIENICLIFSALLFESRNTPKTPTSTEKDKDKEKSSHSWFKLGKSKQQQQQTEREKVEKVLPAADRASFLAAGSSYSIGPASTEMVADSIKNDVVLSDLMRHIDGLFTLEEKKEKGSHISALSSDSTYSNSTTATTIQVNSPASSSIPAGSSPAVSAHAVSTSSISTPSSTIVATTNLSAFHSSASNSSLSQLVKDIANPAPGSQNISTSKSVSSVNFDSQVDESAEHDEGDPKPVVLQQAPIPQAHSPPSSTTSPRLFEKKNPGGGGLRTDIKKPVVKRDLTIHTLPQRNQQVSQQHSPQPQSLQLSKAQSQTPL